MKRTENRQKVIADHAYGGSRQRREGDFLAGQEILENLRLMYASTAC